MKKVAIISKADATGGGASRVADDIYNSLISQSDFDANRYVAHMSEGSDDHYRNLVTSGRRILKKCQSYLRKKGYVDHQPVEYRFLNPDLQKADIIHAHDITTAMSPKSLLKLAEAGRRVIWTLHDQSPLTGGCIYPIGCNNWEDHCGDCPMLDHWPFMTKNDKTLEMQRQRHEVLRSGKIELISPSHWLANLVEKRIPEAIVRVIPNGVDTNIFYPCSDNKAALGKQIPVLIFVAGHTRDMRKGGAYLSEIRDWLFQSGQQLEIMMVGAGNGPEIIHDGPLTIRYMGRINNQQKLAKAYNMADALLIPTHADNQPLVMLEAMACGLPVYGFQTGGISEVVDHTCGMTSAPGDIAGLLRAFFDAYESRILLSLGNAARERIVEYYTLEKFSEAHQSLYKDKSENNLVPVQVSVREPVVNRFAFMVCYHKATPIINSSVFQSVHVGRALSNKPILGTIGDDTGDNISSKNKSYCELTAMYWMWKNMDSEYYGLFHYRRMLNFSGVENNFFYDFSDKTIEKFGWDEATILDMCGAYDIITGPRWNVHPYAVPSLPMSNYDFYAREHHQKDLDILLQVVLERSPELYEHVKTYMDGKTCFYGNVFIMRRDYFKRYAAWVFDILFEVERRSDISNYDSYQGRVWGFLAERLMGAYIDYLSATEEPKLKQLPMVQGLFDKPEISLPVIYRNILKRKKLVKKQSKQDVIHVAMLYNPEHVVDLAVSIASICTSIGKTQRFEFHILSEYEISQDTIVNLQDILGGRHNLIFYHNSSEKYRYDFYWMHDNDALLYLQNILPETVERCIYLDSKTVILGGIDELISLELDGSVIAGVEDEGGVLQARRLNFPATHSYFNGGVLLFDLKGIREQNPMPRYSEIAQEFAPLITNGGIDILNIYYKDNYKKLDFCWNVTDRLYRYNELDHKYSHGEGNLAALDPRILHFNSISPSNRKNAHPLAFFYWSARNKTPWRVSFLKGLRRSLKSIARSKLKSRI
ncbi:DUF4422 domain-containing protein [Bacillus subtilis]|uniref:DUF4422 domain-containing protein n=1 Tax=Pseudochrobactrum asaccharolyticum TaxID=354351 RepID=UPI001F35E2ED|nr:DUF4422 domain-containing protein [Pseudochrobactrum asaccharolyticum]MCF7645053.1 DUF4422 domain-containing protein [Pseudochrobactrum asaccharolyticum]MCF7671518.1 DUF4422 domain-containing protein [Bacillus subtilis]